MNKIIPIKLETNIPMFYKFIEWKLHNVCNYDCSFCHSSNKNGSNRWASLEENKKIVDRLYEISNGSPYWINITGGEPTLYPNLLELMNYMKEKNAFVSLITNGSRTLRWWKEVSQSNCLDTLYFTFHSEQTTDYKHIADVINLFSDKKTFMICMATYNENSVNAAIEGIEFMYENTHAACFLKAMFNRGKKMINFFTDEQKAKIEKLNFIVGKKYDPNIFDLPESKRLIRKLKFTYDDGSVEILDSQKLLKHDKNKFLGWECEIGMNTLRIDSEYVARGVCEVGEKRKMTLENIKFFEEPVICDHNLCFCGTDLVATKRNTDK